MSPSVPLRGVAGRRCCSNWWAVRQRRSERRSAIDHLVGVRVDLEAEVLERFECKFDAARPRRSRATRRRPRRLAAARPTDAPLLGVGLGVPGVFDRDTQDAGFAASRLARSPMSSTAAAAAARSRARRQRRQHARRLGAPVRAGSRVSSTSSRSRSGAASGSASSWAATSTAASAAARASSATSRRSTTARGAACGKRGCLEAVVGDPALVAQARRARASSPRRQGIDASAPLAEAAASRARSTIYADAGAVLGRAVSGLVNVLAPELVLIERRRHAGVGGCSRPRSSASCARTSSRRSPTWRSKSIPGTTPSGRSVPPAWSCRATFTAPLDGENDDSIRARIEAGAAAAEVVA